MDIDDTRDDLIVHVAEWGGVAEQLWVRMTDGTESWIDIRSSLASACYAHPELGSKTGLAEVRAATAAKAQIEARWLAAAQSAFDRGVDRTQIAQAAGLTRDGLYKLLRRRGAVTAPPE